MTRFLLARLATLVGGLFLASLLIFFSLRILPGDVAQVIGGTNASAERIAEIRADLGLDASLFSQYLDWIGGVIRLDLGASLATGSSISEELLEKSEVTLPLTALSMLIALIISLPLGIWSALRSGRPRQTTAHPGILQSAALLGAAIPIVWAGLLATLVFSRWLGWLPAEGFPRAGWADPLASLRSLLLPALVIGLIEGAILFRFVRSATRQALGADHVRTAMAQGDTRTRAILAHGLPGVGLSIISMLGLEIAALLVGAVVVEELFALPGMGRMLVTDVGARDLASVQSTVFVLTALILLVGAIVDVVHRVLDPRLRRPVLA